MRPTVINATVQEFDGTRYYLCGRYFQKRGARLHRIVWAWHNGQIPVGAHIHHRDNDRANNGPENLECLTVQDHLGDRHGEESGRRGRHSIHLARDAACEWHGSDRGRRWHAEHFELHIRPTMDRRVSATCQECGTDYGVSAARIKQGKYCGPNCRARALRKRRKSR